MQPDMGSVSLVGAGPGAADLLTLRAARAIEGAQALLYDALVDPEVIALAPSACLRIQTGKRSGKTSMGQDTINALMLRLARRGLRVVRLKGGDPSVFGRSGEERAYLEHHGVRVDIVPGITAASAAAAQFGFPLTHRGEARGLMMTTARTLEGDHAALIAAADSETTLAIYMGRDRASGIAAALVDAGRSAQTPALAVENAGLPGARLVRTTVGQLAATMEDAGFDGPTLLLVGSVALQARGAEPIRDGLRQSAAR